ncbi:YgiQ family radical SAM protein [uncultured Eubacterium sp.]|uniref:YgiQ family radical SAM protein n=1 Tax=uncultured Eubacterium sp. TaxID=165185 RepID=UPI0025F955AD|nr:YgiQ family radical SAM protein [uncultured Eubacterium sp.]
MNNFLPVTKKEMLDLGWEQPDIVYISGDAYVDHPSFGASIITRVLQARGYKVAVISQPDWHKKDDFMRFGKPRLAFFISSGNIDSMVAHYTVAKKPRRTDAYTAGGVIGKRPDRAVIVYSNAVKDIYPDTPVVIGGLEASLRRFAHYDYWDDKVRPSILLDSRADLLIFGMGENQSIEIADRLNAGENITSIHDVKGTVYAVDTKDTPYVGVECPSYENVCSSKKEYAKASRIQQDEQDHIRGKVIKQKHGKKMIVQNQPMPPLTTDELDWVYSLPYMRTYHPMYEKFGGVPGIQEVEFSITHNRGCFGACNFCSIAFHQGRYITTRSKKSIIAEAKKLTAMPDFKGYIHDIGGPTANFRQPSCEFQKEHGLCKGKKCLAPKPCANLYSNHEEYLDILREVRALPGVKKVFIRSGIRYDYLLQDKDDTFFRELVKYHVSGQLKVAPEHCSAAVLDKMGKPHIEAYIEFSKRYFQYTDEVNKEQYLVPYLMSSHPGSTLNDAVDLALFLKKNHIRPEQVQDFYPTPGTISTTMFYTGLDPYTMEEVYSAKSPHDKALQRALLQYYNPKNSALVEEALRKIHRFDLIGNGDNCLVREQNPRTKSNKYNSNQNYGKNNNRRRSGSGYQKSKKKR